MEIDLTIIAGPTMTNPFAITNTQELQRALHQANTDVLALSTQNSEIAGLARYLSGRLVNLIKAYDAGDQESINNQLADLSRHYQTESAAKSGDAH